ncbi:nuclear transport factor 2 family protein [Pseudonocardia sp.]|uniref:nuclear transport factor 2 family protein n=1 Tax=Pseudonocardia sp. TaxID=60912 RepID=UPI00261625F8|nr:nuclear transport factor 2 family protein [Pseudonocardia sp.]
MDTTTIDRYFTLAARPDPADHLALFADDAVVEDENRTHRGRAAIHAWRAEAPRVSYDVLAVEPGPRARVEIAGDFPGSPVELTFTFGLDGDGRISRLAIRPNG